MNEFRLLNGLLFSWNGFFKSAGGIVLAVAILLAMVTIHEFGHYVAGKILGFKINEFSVGFGPALFKKRSKKTGELFAVRVIPLGGYCAFDGEDETDEESEKGQAEESQNLPFLELESGEAPEADPTADSTANPSFEPSMVEASANYSVKQTEKTEESEENFAEAAGAKFNEQPPWKRIIVLIAGATMNYLLALVLIICMFAFIGRPMYHIQTRTDAENPSAISSGLEAGDAIVSVAGKNVYLVTDFISALNERRAGEEVKVVVFRENTEGKREKITLNVTLLTDANFKSMNDYNDIFTSLGISDYSLASKPVKEGFFASVGHSFAYSVKIGGTVLRSLGELLTGKIGLESMGGPVTTIKVASEQASSGAFSFLNIASFIGVNLAVFNLLPIPALDGSKVIFCIIEWIRKKPINRKVEAIIHFAGIIVLFGFAILVDLLQFIR